MSGWYIRLLLAGLLAAIAYVLLIPAARHDVEYFFDYHIHKSEPSRISFRSFNACVVEVDYTTQTIAISNDEGCTLFKIRSTQAAEYEKYRAEHNLVMPDKGTVLLKMTSSFQYLEYYDAGLMSSCMYSDLHGIRLYLYVQPTKNVEKWRNVLMPRIYGLEAAFTKLPGVDWVLMSDLDTYFDLTPNNIFHVDTLLQRYPKASLVIQGEHALCACIWAVRKTNFSARFLYQNEQECNERKYCDLFPFEQLAWHHLILTAINNRHGYSFPTDVCSINANAYCQGDMMGDLGKPEVAALDWGDIAFVPQNGSVTQPMLHNCLGGWEGCVDLPSYIYHSSHWHWHSYRGKIIEFLRKERPIK